MSKDSIRLHSKHGVAPAMTFCRICGKDCDGLVLLGAKCDKVMKNLYENSDGEFGSNEGYNSYGKNRVPSSSLCPECQKYLDGGGFIMVAKDTGEYLRLKKEEVDSIVGRVADAKGRVLDFDACRGKCTYIEKSWWMNSPEGIRLRDPKEWTT